MTREPPRCRNGDTGLAAIRSELRYTGGNEAAARASRTMPGVSGRPSRQKDDASVIEAPTESAMKSDGGNARDPARTSANAVNKRFSDFKSCPLLPGRGWPSDE